MFTPDVEKLIAPIRIEKPQETFVLPGETEPPESVPAPNPPAALVPAASLAQQLVDEAGRVQELIDTLVETTPAITVSIPEEDQPVLGVSTVSTQEYAAAAADSSPAAVRLRSHFEWGLLQGCGGTSSPDWPVLALPDLHQIQGDLLDAASVVTGRLMERTPVAVSLEEWQATAAGSHLAAVHQALMASSQGYRLKLAQATFTLRQDAASDLLQKMVDPLLVAEVSRMRATIMEIMNGMKALRNLLCHAQFLRAMEFRSVRDALLSAFEDTLLKQLLGSLLVILSQAEQQLIAPVLHMLEHGLGGGPILTALGDAAGQEIASVAGSTMLSLQRRYNDLAADLLRTVDQKTQGQLRKLQTLGERNLINRWVAHLDVGILTLRTALSQNTIFTPQLARRLSGQLLRRLDPPASPLLARLQDHPELSTAQDSPLFNREFVHPPLIGLSGQIQGAFGNLQLPTSPLPSTPSFTGVSPNGQPTDRLSP